MTPVSSRSSEDGSASRTLDYERKPEEERLMLASALFGNSEAIG